MYISAHEVHLWYVYDESIQDTGLLSQYYNIISSEERLKQRRFHFEKHRHQYLITRAMVRTVLSQYVNEISPDKWTFRKNDFGKPYIGNESLAIPLYFNLSHTDKLVVMAVALGQEIGIDVEYLSRQREIYSMASRFFSPTEVEQLDGLPEEHQRTRFFDLWTLKEAYIKACGMGLSIPLDHFSYIISQHGNISISFESERNDQPEHWQFWQFHPSEKHKASMALKSDKVNGAYSIVMRKIIPLLEIVEVDYPIAHGTLLTM